MKEIRKLLVIVALFTLLAGLGSSKVKAAEKVKVYIFEAGGCPWCEREKEYLKGLSSYNEKFEIVEKELYVDHVDWAQGKDFAVGKAVAEAFQSAGFKDAGYTGTPFVVISDLYAAAAYSENLEEFINKAYEVGDKDVVGCYESNGENCLEGADSSIKVDWSLNGEDKKDDKKEVETVTTVVLLLIIAGSIALVIYAGKRNASVTETKTDTLDIIDEKAEKEDIKVIIKDKDEKKTTTTKVKKETKTKPKTKKTQKK